MPVTNVKVKWVDGNQVFYDKDGNIIATWDGTNRKLTVPSGAVLEVAAVGGLTVNGVSIGSAVIADVTAEAAEINMIDGSIAGTAVANKALVLGANKNVDTLAIAASGLKIGPGAGTAVTATAAELNKLAGAGAVVASGTQVAHVADAKVNYTTEDLDTEAEIIAAINTANGKINSILAALEAFGINASS